MSNALPNQFLMYDYTDRSEKPKIDDKTIDKSLFYYDSNAIIQLDVLNSPNNSNIEIVNEKLGTIKVSYESLDTLFDITMTPMED